jgi:hypothetical protein
MTQMLPGWLFDIQPATADRIVSSIVDLYSGAIRDPQGAQFYHEFHGLSNQYRNKDWTPEVQRSFYEAVDRLMIEAFPHHRIFDGTDWK